MEKLLEILNELHPEIDFTTHEELIDDGVLDSLDIVTIVTEIYDKFDVAIPAFKVGDFDTELCWEFFCAYIRRRTLGFLSW